MSVHCDCPAFLFDTFHTFRVTIKLMFLNLPLCWKQMLPPFWRHIFASLEQGPHSKDLNIISLLTFLFGPTNQIPIWRHKDLVFFKKKKKKPIKLVELKEFHGGVPSGPQMDITLPSWQVSVRSSEKHRHRSPGTPALNPDYFRVCYSGQITFPQLYSVTVMMATLWQRCEHWFLNSNGHKESSVLTVFMQHLWMRHNLSCACLWANSAS